MRKIALVPLLALLAGVAAAQTVARVDVAPVSAVNFETGLVNAASTTLTFQNDGATFLALRNVSPTAVNVRFTTQAGELNVGGFGRVSLTDLVVSVPSNGRALIGPFPTGRWNDAAGWVNATISGTAFISASAVRAAQ